MIIVFKSIHFRSLVNHAAEAVFFYKIQVENGISQTIIEYA